MASSYDNDLRLNEMGTGDASGSWGTNTNANLTLIGEALGFGTEAITTNADAHTSTIADGGTDPIRAIFIKYTGTLDSACTITIGPNTVNKFCFIHNATSGSQSIIISQGSGANVTIATGQTKGVYLDGAGSGAAVVDAFATLSVVDLLVDDDLTVTDDASVGGALDVTGVATAATFEPDGDTAAGDNAAIGYTAAEGLILTGQGSTNDVTIKNDADADVITIATGTTVVGIPGSLDVEGAIDVNGTSNLDAIDVDGAANFATDVTFADGADIITASAGDNNVRVGVNAGNSIASGGNYNVVLGDEAGTALTTGDGNVAIGFEALSTEDAHGNNVAVGYRALKTLNVGATAYNTAVGNDAGLSMTYGVNNTLVGGLAGDALTGSADYSGGANNVAVGRAALGGDTLGSASVAIGFETLLAQNFTSATDTYNTAVGYRAGLAVSTGTVNTLIGALAGNSLDVGAANVAVGYSALATEDGDGNNVAVGYLALTTLNVGGDGHNTGVGHKAGQLMTSGIRNTIIGALAGDALTDADDNTAVGMNALSTCQLGSANTAVGKDALEDCNPASAAAMYNSAFGMGAGANVTTGTINTFIGALSGGGAVVTGTHNCGSGAESLYAITSGSYNCGLGYQAGAGITTGEYNYCIGYQAGKYNTPITTGGKNIVIGAYAKTGAEAAEHQIVMGYNVQGAGDNNFTFGDTSTDSNIEFGATSITAPSDERYKEEIETSTAGLAFIKDLRPVTFKWKKEKDVPSDHPAYVEGSDTRVMNSSGETNHGFIAQEVKAAIDNHSDIKDGFDMWSEQGSGGRQRLGPSSLIPILVKAIQELEARIAVLEG